MATVLKHLREFNRKERFCLVGTALGNQQFHLSKRFRETLGEALNLQVPEDAFAAMDYHLDWLAASLQLAATLGAGGPYRRDPRMLTATQEDIDFLVAYEADEEYYIILLEAKGVTPYSNHQFHSKVKRLAAIFEVAGEAAAQAIPHFALISPKRPRKLSYEGCPDWMMGLGRQVPWVRLPLPTNLKKVVRCHQDETVSQDGNH